RYTMLSARVIPPSIHDHLISQSAEEVIDFICDQEPEKLAKSTVISEIPDNVQKINEKLMNKLPGGLKIYEGIDMPTWAALQSMYGMFLSMPEETREEMLRHHLPYQLKLKIACLDNHYIACDRIGEYTGEKRVFLRRMKFYSEYFYRVQFPLRLAYSMTMAEAKNVAFERIGMVLINHIDTYKDYIAKQIKYIGAQNIKVYSCYYKPNFFETLICVTPCRKRDRRIGSKSTTVPSKLKKNNDK
ncbi:hypothetical protein PENTCL1PPCAC_23038, partial [Pristionchus entomophagus]